ncbi:HNH endonuclease-domain-containing protein [Lipomyces tetrasporus]|uniref:HNH endonuclease-domain-containing protein n=1 Tax=Lipomyces tetrasporus TaxID=54092 RepID=A0AAD7QY96_9ASCO|nr:HNH endonuclease-domain-containing protein [Lipomyces tetrasporus]KAJ8103590.1 HNH endonuclease-domain-containing protein [Lipomyces tetrasporus]
MPTSRSLIRNVHLYDPSRPNEPLGGLYLNPSVTRKKFLRMLEIFIRANSPYSVLLRGTEIPLTPTDDPLQPGHYDIVCDVPGGIITVTDERCIARALSRSVSTRRNRKFREQVRNRDGKCVITGLPNPVAFMNDWTSFEAAHIFPLSHEELFTSLNYPQFVANRTDETDIGINSCQNGLLMQSTIHQQFDTFKFGIDPDDNYTITCFSIDLYRVDGRTLDPVCRDPADERAVVDEFLRWHFRQAVLANMKGEGESVFEFDFPDGSDMVAEILSGPRAGERMEAELSLRLNSVSSIP